MFSRSIEMAQYICHTHTIYVCAYIQCVCVYIVCVYCVYSVCMGVCIECVCVVYACVYIFIVNEQSVLCMFLRSIEMAQYSCHTHTCAHTRYIHTHYIYTCTHYTYTHIWCVCVYIYVVCVYIQCVCGTDILSHPYNLKKHICKSHSYLVQSEHRHEKPQQKYSKNIYSESSYLTGSKENDSALKIRVLCSYIPFYDFSTYYSMSSYVFSNQEKKQIFC